MAILYYPSRPYRGTAPAIDRAMAIRKPISVAGSQNLASSSLTAIISNNDNWQLDSVGLCFSNVAARNFSAYIMNGRNVVQNLNDSLWFYVTGSGYQSITLAPGFYTGAQLAVQLKTQLDANAAFITAGATPFTVTYVSATGCFTITPNAGQVAYLNSNAHQELRLRDSIAGHLFGLNVTTALSASITSDTNVYGLNTEMGFINETASTVVTYLHDTAHTLTVDQAVHLIANSASDVTIDYTIDYETIV